MGDGRKVETCFFLIQKIVVSKYDGMCCDVIGY
jgi:hypothetical protein